jgi:hypothetical protein
VITINQGKDAYLVEKGGAVRAGEVLGKVNQRGIAANA